MGPWLRELAPVARGSQDGGSGYLGHALFTLPVHQLPFDLRGLCNSRIDKGTVAVVSRYSDASNLAIELRLGLDHSVPSISIFSTQCIQNVCATSSS